MKKAILFLIIIISGKSYGQQDLQTTLTTGNTTDVPVKHVATGSSQDVWFGEPTNFGTTYTGYGIGQGFSSGWANFTGVNGSGRPNVVGTLLGYNHTLGGGRNNTSEAGFGFRAETHYEMNGGNQYFEFHLPEVTTASGVGYRPFSIYALKTSPGGYIHCHMPLFQYFTGTTSNEFQWYDAASAGANTALELLARSSSGTTDGKVELISNVRSSNNTSTLNRTKITTIDGLTHFGSDDGVFAFSPTSSYAGTVGTYGLNFDGNNNRLGVNAPTSGGYNFDVGGSARLTGTTEIYSTQNYTRSSIVDQKGGITFGGTITDNNSGNNSFYSWLNVGPQINHVGSIPGGSMAANISPSFTAGGGNVDIWGMSLVKVAPTFTGHRYLYVRGFNFDITENAAGPDIRAFENNKGNNYFNTTSGNTGIGYSSGALGSPTTLPEKLSVNGNIYSTGTIMGTLAGSNLTAGRIPFVTTGGALTDVANFTWDNTADVLNIPGAVAISGNGGSPALEISGDVIVGGSGTYSGTWTTSDKRYKSKIEVIEDVKDRLLKVVPYSYTYKKEEFKDKGFDDKTHMGFLAQDIEELFPSLVKKGADGYYAVNYTEFIPLLLQAMKEQEVAIKKQNAVIKQQQTSIESLTTMINSCCQSGNVETTGILQNNKLGVASTLAQNIPNPTSGETVIGFNIVGDFGRAFIGVYDLNGRELKRISIAKGMKDVRIEKGQLTSGQYVYSLIVDNNLIDSKKMVVIEQ